MPTGWGMWPKPTGSEKMAFEIAEDPAEAPEGSNYLRIRSETKSSRLGISYPIKGIADTKSTYLCTFYVKPRMCWAPVLRQINMAAARWIWRIH